MGEGVQVLEEGAQRGQSGADCTLPLVEQIKDGMLQVGVQHQACPDRGEVLLAVVVAVLEPVAFAMLSLSMTSDQKRGSAARVRSARRRPAAPGGLRVKVIVPRMSRWP